MSIKGTAVAVGVIDVVALGLFAGGMGLAFGTLAALVVLIPAAIVIGVLCVTLLGRKRAGTGPLTWGGSFGSRKMHRATAFYLAIAGIGITWAVALLDGINAALLVALAVAGFIVSSLLLAAHGD
jgi:hypothetical protein